MTDAATPPATVRPDTAHALLHAVATAQVTGRAPATVSGVGRDGHLAWSAGRGTVGGVTPTAGTQFRIGSITKGMTAALVLRLRDEGRLRLDDPLDAHVTGTGLGDRTIRGLLSHTAGLAAEPPGAWWERSAGVPWDELAPTLGTDRALEPAGGRFHYSNVGYGLLGQVIERHRGVSWFEALRAEVLLPLGMTRTTYAAQAPHADGFAVHPWADLVLPEPQQDALAMAPAGVLWSTVADLTRWCAFLTGDTAGVLSADTVAEMRSVRVVADGAAWTSGYGLGLQVFRSDGREYIGHGGSIPGFVAVVVADVERRTSATIMANTTGGFPLGGQALLEILERHEPTIPRPWHPADAVPAGLLELLGLWHWGPSPYLLRLRADGRLELSPVASGGRGARFRPTGGTAWAGLDGYFDGETLTVVRRPDGSVSHLDIGTFAFTREPYGPADVIPGGVDPAGWRPGPPDA